MILNTGSSNSGKLHALKCILTLKIQVPKLMLRHLCWFELYKKFCFKFYPPCGIYYVYVFDDNVTLPKFLKYHRTLHSNSNL